MCRQFSTTSVQTGAKYDIFPKEKKENTDEQK
jgi:hypothetical protein